jgi:hypothetical protein
MTNVGTGQPTVADYRGLIVPDSLLARHKRAHFEAGWVRVAEVYMASDAYKQKLNFDLVRVGERPNVVYYKRDRSSGEWQAKIVSASGQEVVKNVRYRPAPRGVAVPATARWRWLPDDETVWTKCDEGCCEIIG